MSLRVIKCLNVVKKGDGDDTCFMRNVTPNHEDYTELANGVGKCHDARDQEPMTSKRHSDREESIHGARAQYATSIDEGLWNLSKGHHHGLDEERQGINGGADHEAREAEGERGIE